MFHDILKEDGNFKCLEDLRRQFNVEISAMEYNGLISAIPRYWKIIVKGMKIPEQAVSNQEQPFISCNNRLLALGVTTNRDVYWKLVTKKRTQPVCAVSWCTRYNIDLENWKIVFKYYATIKDTKMKAFQFKILNNIVPCNLYLKRIGKSDTDKCPNCNELDDLSHYLVHCPAVTALWKQVIRWWTGITNQTVELVERDILIGLEQRPVKIEMAYQLEEIIMAIKWRIHANKQLGTETCLYQILCSIRKMITIQKLIAMQRHTNVKHDIIWGKIEDYLT
jgi:hypothetical protein